MSHDSVIVVVTEWNRDISLDEMASDHNAEMANKIKTKGGKRKVISAETITNNNRDLITTLHFR